MSSWGRAAATTVRDGGDARALSTTMSMVLTLDCTIGGLLPSYRRDAPMTGTPDPRPRRNHGRSTREASVGRRDEAARRVPSWTSPRSWRRRSGCPAAGNPEPLTVRSLGKELGADPTAIYRHFRDKDELRPRRAGPAHPSTRSRAVDPDAGWRERMTQLANVPPWTIFGDHPSIGARRRRPRPPAVEGELAAIEMIMVAMNEAGLGSPGLRPLLRRCCRPT